MKISPFSYYILSLGSKYSPQHSNTLNLWR
jgi:hypothetical protein